MRPIKVCAYWTNHAYRMLSRKLKASLDEFMMSYDISQVGQESWTWQDAVTYKPQFILQCLERYPEDDILYTDADSIMRLLLPTEFLREADFGAVWWKRSKHHEEELLTGTMFFANNNPVKTLVKHWAEITPQYKTAFTPEGTALSAILSGPMGSVINIRRLPPAFCFIHDDMRQMYPDIHPIFEHYQASRLNRYGTK